MRLKKILDEDLSHYKKPSMVLFTPSCDFKCCLEQGIDVCTCQNSSWAREPDHNYTPKEILDRYNDNLISKAIVFAGLEPLINIEEVVETIDFLVKNKVDADIVVYTGYREDEEQVISFRKKLKEKEISGVILKVGRFVFNDKSHKDKILGMTLASRNQYAIVV